MKIVTTIQLILITTLISAPVYSEPAKSVSVKKLLQKTGAGDMSMQMMNRMIPALKKMMPDAPEKFWTDVMSEIDGNAMENMVIPVYQKYLDEKDIHAINAFYDTPAGKKLIRTQPAIMQESMMLGQQWGQEIAKKILTKYKTEIKDKQKIKQK